MANTLTGLIPVLYEALDIISRELCGFIPAVGLDVSAEMAAKDETIRSPIVPAQTAYDIIPGLYAPDSGDQTIGYVDMSIDYSRMVPVRWSGDEQKGLKNTGKYRNIAVQRFAQAMRTLVNEVEADLAEAAYKGASRAYDPGASPFATSLADAAQAVKILDDNGAPSGDRSLVINTTAAAALRTLASLNAVSYAGTDRTLRQGTLLPVFGLDIKQSAQVISHTKGTATGMDCTAVEPVGETTIAVDGSNSGTILAGDLITNDTDATDDNLYVVASATASGVASGNIVINTPGLVYATEINDEWIIQNSYAANVAFHRNAIQLLTRAPALPEEGDQATDVTTIVDPLTGIAFQVCMYKQYKQVHYEVGLAWGVKAIKPAHIVILVGR